jgi:ribonuclease P protein component
MTVPSRYGKAPERSRFKRVIREIFRTSCANIPLDINVIPRQRSKGASFEVLRQDLLALLIS